ncbi:hypothetical protein PV371_26595 [Streptomyces sp. TX20-6-3]|uniref:hypothetical protein n=1 Tax=Streptomyces sp. TX20-6-3 TaxID=3028705 RepID=UPI0029B3B193|nr:hypothetical protein [Streptomyces sp. TX20-6-3]MDX2563206.1 hypothetical protein [Streptomyces sp. TX20-6-3]
MPRNSHARRPLLVAVAVTGVTIALTVTVLPGPDRPPAGERPPPSRPIGTTATTADDRLLHDAEQRLLRDCMGRHGFTYRVFPLGDEPESTLFPYVVDDADWARRHGYGAELRRQREVLAKSDPNRAYFAALPADRRAAALVAANGPSPDGLTVRLPGGGTMRRSDRGCVAEAQRRLYGDLGAWFRSSIRVGTLRQILRSRVVADTGYQKTLGAWRRCMGRSGYAFTSPAAARAAALSPVRPLPEDREIRLALAEARCAAESGLSRTARRLDAHHDRLLAEEYRADVETRDRLTAAALPRARRILGHVPQA